MKVYDRKLSLLQLTKRNQGSMAKITVAKGDGIGLEIMDPTL